MKLTENWGQVKRLVILINRVTHQKVILGLIALAIVGISLFHLLSLTSYPPLFIDESWYANVSYSWLTKGQNYDTMHALARPSFTWPYLGSLPWLTSYAIAGLGLLQARFVSWIFGLLLVISTYLVGKQSYSRVSGALAALFLVINPSFLQASHYVRPDIMLAVFVMLSYFLLVQGIEKNNRWLHLSAGVVIGLSVDIHLNAIIFIFGFLAIYLYKYKKKILRTAGFWAFILGGFLSLIYYLSVHIFPDPGGFFNFYRYSLGSEHQMPISSLNPMVLLGSLRAEIGRYHFFDNSLVFVLLGASLAYLAWRRRLADSFLLIFTGTAFLGFVLFAGNKHDIYAILLFPFFALIISEGLISSLQDSQQHLPVRAFILVLILLSLVSGLYALTRPVLVDRDYNYYDVTDRIREVVPDGSIVMGLPNWWLGLADDDYRSVMGLTYLHFLKNMSLEEGFETLKPDYLIYDSGLNGLLVDEGYFGSEGFEVYKMPRSEFESIITRNAHMVDEFSNPWHGYFQIYKFNWSN